MLKYKKVVLVKALSQMAREWRSATFDTSQYRVFGGAETLAGGC
jgi:hypothetical protein